MIYRVHRVLNTKCLVRLSQTCFAIWLYESGYLWKSSVSVLDRSSEHVFENVRLSLCQGHSYRSKVKH